MASDVAQETTRPIGAAAAPAAPEPAPGKLYRRRFLVAYGLVALAAAGTIAGVAIAVAGGGVGGSSTPWSDWKPTASGQDAAKQIAEHVSKAYRLPDGNQLVDVIAKPPSVSPSTTSIPIRYLAVRGGKNKNDQLTAVSESNSVMYSLCGLGTSCSIASGKPSVERGTLVRREILELALYTFKYARGINHVIAFMPPQPGARPQYVVYLRSIDLEQQLKQPLHMTLGKKVPLPAAIPPNEVHAVDAATERRVFSFSLSQTQNGDAVFVFQPLPA